jgi:predicted amidohydrolase
VGGYPKFSTFGVAVGVRTPEGRDEYLRYHQAAIELPSPALTQIEAVSREVEIFLVVGVIERDGGTLYCTVVFVDPIEGFLAKHRKLMPTASERVIWALGGADTLPVVEKKFPAVASASGGNTVKTKLSATICW